MVQVTEIVSSGKRYRMIDLPAEAGHLLLVEDLRRCAREHLVDDETHGVRADIDNGDRIRKREPPRSVPELRPCGRPGA